ncbi:hypothetical protein [Allopontixanthobacter sediminis]|uniref:Uncharacterized protein n=1 Tax=Allopontixanthobacter sediminis TaxID=1689985 RepID=A0A845B1Z5_9SPHN|nr:hypothetical protein [Allopontixanthobacter sediminis]MXP44308.1 hypothetical protein [Allopontixanthobacter sediminis]
MNRRSRNKAGIGGIAPALLAAAGLAVAVPTAGLAVSGIENSPTVMAGMEFVPFTPATVDPQLARRVHASVQARGQALRFTPASNQSAQDRTFTVAVRLDDATARAISIRTAGSMVSASPGLGSPLASGPGEDAFKLAPTRYNLGVARGYRGFAKAPTAAKPDNGSTVAALALNKAGLLDLADFKPAEGAAEKPSRFQPRIALESEKGTTGRSRGTLESLGEQTVDVGGAYRITGNLDVTAGVRLSQDRDRIAPLTDSVQDSQAVYVGTQFRF